MVKFWLENQAKFDVYNKRSEEYLSLLKQIRVDSIDVGTEVGVSSILANTLELMELSSINKVGLVYVSLCSNTGSMRDYPY